MIRAGMKLRAARIALRIRWIDEVEQQRDEARASRDEARELRAISDRARDVTNRRACALDEQIGETERVLTSRGYPHPGGGENLALSVDNALDREASRYTELRDGIQAELRATGHAAEGEVVRAVDAAIDRERCGAQEFLEQVAREIGAPPGRRFGRYSWPADTEELLRHVAKRRRDAEIGIRAIRDRDRAVQLLADMLGKFAPDAFVATRAELEELQGAAPSDHDEALAEQVRRAAYDPAMGGDIEPPPGRPTPPSELSGVTVDQWRSRKTHDGLADLPYADQAIARAREYLDSLGYGSLLRYHDINSILRAIGVRPAGPTVDDNERAVERAREYLISLGHESIVNDHGEDITSMLRAIGVPAQGKPHELSTLTCEAADLHRAVAERLGCELVDADSGVGAGVREALTAIHDVLDNDPSALPQVYRDLGALTAEVERTRAVLAPDVDTTGTPLDTLAARSIDSNRTQAVARELRWWSWGRIVRSHELLARADDLVGGLVAPWVAGERDALPPRPDVRAADREVEVPF